MTAQRALRLVCVGLIACSAVSCKKSKSDRPYTPFGVASVAQEPPAATSATPEATAFVVEKAVLAPVGAKQWAFGNRVLQAVGNFVFEQGLAADFTADGAPDVVAWLSRDPHPKSAAATPAGELWLYPASAQPTKLLDTPGFLPAGDHCSQAVKLTRTGPQTVTLEIATNCEPAPLGRMPTHSLSVVAPGREAPHVLTLRIAAVADSRAEGANASVSDIAYEVASLDRDQDGRDDIELTAKITAPGSGAVALAPDTEVKFVWLDRKAGLSPDTVFPAKSFHDIGSIEVVRANGKNTSARSLARINTARRMWGALCAEGRVPVLFDHDNNPLPCTVDQNTAGFFATAEMRAFLTQGQPGDALTALLRANWYGKELSDKVKADLTTELEKAIRVTPAHSLALSTVSPSQPSSIPRFSPLAFGPQGLLIQNAEGVTALDLEALTESDANEEVDPWPLTVISPQGERLVGVAYPCDHPSVTLLTTRDSGAPAASIATALLAPRPGTCGNPTAPSHELPLRPVAWGKAGLNVLLAGSEVGPRTAATTFPLGSARSANGEHAVVATDLGLLLIHKGNAELWRSTEVPTKRLSECVVDDRAEHIACIDKGHARVFVRSALTP